MSILTLKSFHIYNSTIIVLDFEIVWVAVGIMLLSNVQANMYDNIIVLSTYGGLVGFTSHPDVGEHAHLYHLTAGFRKLGCSDRDFSM